MVTNVQNMQTCVMAIMTEWREAHPLTRSAWKPKFFLNLLHRPIKFPPKFRYKEKLEFQVNE